MGLRLAIGVATMQVGGGLPGLISTWVDQATTPLTPVSIRRNTPIDNLRLPESYDVVSTGVFQHADVLAYLHDDVECFEPGWDQRVLAEFEDPTVGIVGFGGGLRHGDGNLYKTPYRLQQLARFGYRSNTRDAESHGERFRGACDVAVLDGFALVVRREFLDRCGGWNRNMEGIRFHCYDYAICGLAHRFGYRVRLVGVDCQHYGGRTSTTEEYQEWLRVNKGMTDAEDHERAHRWFYEEFRDVMPYSVEETGVVNE